ncbi:MAG: hypothetical protein A2033_16105 [Bacteroidetes bacterium GWA2_31_9]|nr:MAG: hypothetical protein A2033_16105 [Bacteroidetes bacterium GWA2_31_9]
MESFIRTISIVTFLFAWNVGMSQNFTQVIKGRVIDQQTQNPLPGVAVIVKGTDPVQGASTDMDGYFKIEKVKIGRVSLIVSYLGYHTQYVDNISLSSGKELILNIKMEEEVNQINEVVVSAEKDKSETINTMATISARTFSVEESQRYAGARNDVSRMAANYAGVNTANDAVNDIVIRGNSPNGLLWRLEGVDIPNPNHFGTMGATGGPVSMLNNNLLSNSDFMTGAFPAEYGNALSGVFDLKMRSGNYEKHEFLAQVGLNGFEFGAEGPISLKSRSSYLINYRYSTLGAMAALGIDFGTGTAIPKYQDLSFKFNYPTKKFGNFSIFGLGGISAISFINSTKDTTNEEQSMYGDNRYDIYSKNIMGVAGLTHTYIINEKTYTKLILAGSGIENSGILDTVYGNGNTALYMDQTLRNTQLTASFYVNKKINVHHNVRVGIIDKNLGYTFIDSVYVASLNGFQTLFNSSGSSNLLQTYIEWQYKITDNLIFNSGVNYMHLTLNNSNSIEPRAGIKYLFGKGQSLSAGYGLHSMMQTLFVYFNETRLDNGTYVRNNENLDFTKAHHFVLAYDNQLTKTLRFKAETYYQHVFDAVVNQYPDNYSLLNSSSISFVMLDSMKNAGSGENYGVELTLEKFMDKGFYGLFTTSIFKSEYKGSDKVTHPTAFDGRFVFNVLAGKEFGLNLHKENAKSKKYIVVDAKATYAGGQRYVPIDLEKSAQAHSAVYDNENAYSVKFRNYFRADLRVAYKIEGKKVSQEMAFDIQNISNNKNPLYMNYNAKTGKEEVVNQLGLFPMVQYRVVF